MRKGIKILGKVFSAAVLLLIIVPVALSLLLDIPAVQNYAVHRAARFVSRKLETTVSIDRVDIGIFSKVRVKGFYVEDYQRDTLLYVGKLDAFITSFGIFGGGLELSRGEIADARLYLRQTPGGEMNIKQIVDRISDPDKPKKGNFRLSLKKASIENMDLCLERLDHRDPEHGIDFSHMHLYGITARVDDFTIDGQAIYTSIAAFSARERSGFVLNHLAGRFYMTQGCLGFENASIITPRSNVNFPFVSLAGDSWAQYKDFIGEVRIDASMRNTTVSTDDIAFFAPKLRDWHVDFTDVNVEVAGVVSDFTGRIRSMQIGEGTTLVADASVKGLPDIRKTRFDLSVPRLRSTARAVDELALGIAGRKLSDKLVGVLGNSGQIDLNARFRGLLSSFDMQLGAATGVGNVSCNLKMAPVKGGLSSVRGDVETRNLRLGELLDRRDLLGNATLTAYVDGVIGRGVADANVVGNVTQLGFNGYVYDSLRLDGRLRNREFDGRITARDPNLDFDFFGTVDLNDSVPRYDFTMDLRHADLARLHVNRRDSVSQLSGRIVAAAGGRSLDDLNGRIQVTDARYRYNDKEIAAASMTVTGENSERSKFVELRSDFADVTFRSKTSYRTVFEYLRRSAWKYLPMLGGEKWEETPSERKAAVANDFSLLSVNIRNFNPVADAVSTGLQIADGSSLQLLFNPASDQLSLKAASEYIERRRMLATRLSVNASNRGDSLAVYASAEDLYAGVLHLPRLSLTGGARQNRVQLSAGFDDTLRRVSGLVGFRAAVADEHGPNGRVVDLRILPSHITRGDKTWQIFARKILLDTAQVVIDKFYVMNREQELLLDGVASRSREDSVTLSLHNFDLAPFAQVAERMGYYIEGRTNGSAAMKSVLRGGEITADILLDSVEVNDIPAPPMRLASRWDFARSRAGVTVSDRIRRDTLIRGFYAPDRNRYFARLDVDSLDMALLDPILAGVVSSTEGMASAGLTLQGQGRKADLEGEIRVAGLKTTVDFTQVTYSMPEAVLNVKNNRFRASNVPIFDPRGNRGRFDFDMSLQHLSNISYDVRVAPQQMLVLDTDSDDNDMFYGRVFATGAARILGDKGAVNMDITASTDGNSSFVMPLSSKSNISNADFVVFEQPEQALLRAQAPPEIRRREPDEDHPRARRAARRRSRTRSGGQHGQGARRGRAEPPDQPQGQYFRDLRRLYDRGGQFHAVAPADHQQTLHHRERFVDPVDRVADERDARHRRRVQGQGVAATPPAGHGRPRGRPFGSRGVRHSPRRAAFEPHDHLRRAGSRLRSRDAEPDRQCSLDPRDGRHAVPLPAAVQQLHVRELVAGLVEHRQLGVGGHGTGVRVEHGQQLAFVVRLQRGDPLPAQVGTDERRGRFRAVEEPDQQPAVRRGRGQLPDRQQAGREQFDVQLHGRGLHHLPDRPGRDAQAESLHADHRPLRREPGFAGDRHRRLLQGGFRQPARPAAADQGAFYEQEAQGAAHRPPYGPRGRKGGRRCGPEPSARTGGYAFAVRIR